MWSVVGPHRDSNEDILLPTVSIEILGQTYRVSGIFDGHGGTITASYLKEQLIHILKGIKADDIAIILREAVRQLEYNIRKLQLEDGSTFLIVLLAVDHYYIVNVGDSSAILFRKNTKLQQLGDNYLTPINMKNLISYQLLTIPHRVDERISYQEADVLYSINLSRSMGDIGFKKRGLVSTTPDIYKYSITSNDLSILLCSDGLTDYLSLYEINYYYRKYDENFGEDLIKYAYQKGSTDNISIILINLLQ